jgi:lipid-A-disaccharide synthase-like uncharacterized protein
MAVGPDGFSMTAPSIVLYRPLGPIGRVLWALLLVAAFVMTIVIGVANSSSVPVLFSFLWLLGAWLVLQFARVEVDREARTLTIVRVRWPLHEQRRSFPLDAVRDAIVQVTPGRRGSTAYSVALVVDGEPEPVPLLVGASSGRGTKDQAASEIQQLLQRRDPSESARGR